MVNYQILIDDEDYTKYVALPFKEQYVLDSALDNGVMTLPMTDRDTIFKPFTKVTITKDNDTFDMYVTSDKMTEIVGTGKYTHELVLIEETKLLEKKVVDTNTTTQPLIHDYLKGAVGVWVTRVRNNGESFNYYLDDSVKDLIQYEAGEYINLGSARSIMLSHENLYTHELGPLYNQSQVQSMIEAGENGWNTINFGWFVSDDNSTLRSASGTISTGNNDWNNDISIIMGSGGFQDNTTYHCQVEITQASDTNIKVVKNFDFTFMTQVIARTKKSITDVVNRLLAITETLRTNESPALVFNQEQATFYDQRDENLQPIYPAPEFAMTKSTLRECLDQVGSYIHSIVRLVGNVIYFDKLGGTTQTELAEDLIGNYETLDSEQYASQLDSIVANLTNIDDADTGTISEPFKGAFKTVRAETGTLRIGDGTNDTSAIIETDYPIEKIQSLICGYITVDGVDYRVGDITPYVYESAEYGLLSATEGNYPYSKGYALTYTQGEKNITGLTFKLPNPISPILSNQAILNIISRKIGRSVQDLFSVQNIAELQFRLIYYPSTTARVEQVRSDINNYSMELTSIYNQSANKVDSRAYGENLKGTIARLGNIEKFITFTTNSPDNLPNVGEYVTIDNEDYYIATLDIENENDYTKYTVGLSKDFNALSKYIGIKNNIRLYEVSEKQSVERYVTRHDYCVIGTSTTSDYKDLLTEQAKGGIMNQFGYDLYPINNVSVARVRGKDLNGISKAQVDLSVISLAMGNSLYFGFKYADNYSAGNASVLGTNSSGDAYYRLNSPVKYTDDFGELETLSINMFSELQYVEDKTTAINSGNALPNSTLPEVASRKLLTTGDYDIVLKKDNREQINFSYQLHFVTNDNIIIGSQLAQGSYLIGTENGYFGEKATLYILPNRINKFAKQIDLTGASQVYEYEYEEFKESSAVNYNAATNQVVFTDMTANANGKSWVIVDSENKLLIGKNIEIKSGDTIEMPTMTYTHKII